MLITFEQVTRTTYEVDEVQLASLFQDGPPPGADAAELHVRARLSPHAVSALCMVGGADKRTEVSGGKHLDDATVRVAVQRWTRGDFKPERVQG